MRSAQSLLVIALFAAGSAKVTAPWWEQMPSGRVPPATSRPTGPLRYRLTTEYTMLGPQGAEAGTHVVTGEFTASEQEIEWTSVTTGLSKGHAQPADSVRHEKYMEGFRYPRAGAKATAPEFFHEFPPTAHDQRNLVWDELMFESFVGQVADSVRLNRPFLATSGDVSLAGAGTFTNRRIELTWTGIGWRHGEQCLLIHYESLLNSLKVNSGPVAVAARSDYLGDMWVSVRSRTIEYGTLLEEVAGTLTTQGPASSPQPLHVMRIATIERLL